MSLLAFSTNDIDGATKLVTDAIKQTGDFQAQAATKANFANKPLIWRTRYDPVSPQYGR